MAATWTVFYLFMPFIQSQRVVLVSWPMTSWINTNGWEFEFQDINSDSGIVYSAKCPNDLEYCISITGSDEFYTHVDTTGYSDIQVAYDIRTEGVDSGESCSFWYIANNSLPSEGNWTLISKHKTNSASQSISHSLLPSDVDNITSLGLDFWANMDLGEYCYLNNVVITGIPDGGREILLASTLRDSISPWSIRNGDAELVSRIKCPGYSSCYRLGADAEIYTHVNTTGYRDIQISYDICTKEFLSDGSCSFWYIANSSLPSEGAWILLSEHRTNSEPQSISHSLPSDVDNTASFGLDFWANMGLDAYCFLNNIVVSGIPFTQSSTSEPTSRPTLEPTAAPTETFSNHPTLKPSVNPTKGPTNTETSSNSNTVTPSADHVTSYEVTATEPSKTFSDHPTEILSVKPTKQPTNTQTSSDPPTATPSVDHIISYESTSSLTAAPSADDVVSYGPTLDPTAISAIPYEQTTVTQMPSNPIPSASNTDAVSDIVTTHDKGRASLDTMFTNGSNGSNGSNKATKTPLNVLVIVAIAAAAIVVICLCNIMICVYIGRNIMKADVDNQELNEEKKPEIVTKIVEENKGEALACKEIKKNMMVGLRDDSDEKEGDAAGGYNHTLSTQTTGIIGIAPDEFVIEEDGEKYDCDTSEFIQ